MLTVSGSAAPAGPVVRQADPHHNGSCNQSACGARIQKCRALRSRPKGLRDRARQQLRSTSRGVAGCPRRWGRRRQQSGSGSGEGLPLKVAKRSTWMSCFSIPAAPAPGSRGKCIRASHARPALPRSLRHCCPYGPTARCCDADITSHGKAASRQELLFGFRPL